MTVLGFWVVVFAFISSAASALLYARNGTDRRPVQSARRWLFLSAAGVVVGSVILLVLLLGHDYGNGYVYSYSSTSLPLHFLISSFWAGQEGSFLFWALCSALISVVLYRSAARSGAEASVMTVFMALQSFLLLLLIAKSPFRTVWEMIPGVPAGEVPPDGRGLNPLLQNFWMVLHPPVLFIGFAAMAVPYSFALAGLWKNHHALVAGPGFPWVIFSTLLLGVGIMLGAYWAYGVLGWGGYWGWDPVENSSLIPWLTGMALVHTIIVYRKTGGLLRTTLFLAIVSFVLVVYSTFLTRSGILGDASVHSFTDPGTAAYTLLVVFLAALTAAGFGLLVLRRKVLVPARKPAAGVTRETMLAVGALALVLTALVVLFGTSLPIFSARTVEPSFYDATTLPLAIAMALLIGASLYTQWGIGGMGDVIRRSLTALGVSVVATAVAVWLGARDIWMALFLFTAFFALAVNAEFAWKTRKAGVLRLGGKLAHLGLAMFFVGVVATGRYSRQQDLALRLRVPHDALGYTFTYVGNRSTPDGKYAFDVIVEKDSVRLPLAPVMFRAGEQGIMRTPDIVASFTRDIYLSPLALEGGGHAHESYTIPKGESVTMGGVTARFVRFDMGAHGADSMAQAAGRMTIGSVLELSNGKTKETVIPVAVYPGNGPPEYRASASRLMGAEIRLVSMNVGMGQGRSTVTVEIHRDGESHQPETLMVEASVKPLVSLLWIGTVAMFAGMVIALFRRNKE